jgi:hypothetical protein
MRAAAVNGAANAATNVVVFAPPVTTNSSDDIYAPKLLDKLPQHVNRDELDKMSVRNTQNPLNATENCVVEKGSGRHRAHKIPSEILVRAYNRTDDPKLKQAIVILNYNHDNCFQSYYNTSVSLKGKPVNQGSTPPGADHRKMERGMGYTSKNTPSLGHTNKKTGEVLKQTEYNSKAGQIRTALEHILSKSGDDSKYPPELLPLLCEELTQTPGFNKVVAEISDETEFHPNHRDKMIAVLERACDKHALEDSGLVVAKSLLKLDLKTPLRNHAVAEHNLRVNLQGNLQRIVLNTENTGGGLIKQHVTTQVTATGDLTTEGRFLKTKQALRVKSEVQRTTEHSIFSIGIEQSETGTGCADYTEESADNVKIEVVKSTLVGLNEPTKRSVQMGLSRAGAKLTAKNEKRFSGSSAGEVFGAAVNEMGGALGAQAVSDASSQFIGSDTSTSATSGIRIAKAMLQNAKGETTCAKMGSAVNAGLQTAGEETAGVLGLPSAVFEADSNGMPTQVGLAHCGDELTIGKREKFQKTKNADGSTTVKHRVDTGLHGKMDVTRAVVGAVAATVGDPGMAAHIVSHIEGVRNVVSQRVSVGESVETTSTTAHGDKWSKESRKKITQKGVQASTDVIGKEVMRATVGQVECVETKTAAEQGNFWSKNTHEQKAFSGVGGSVHVLGYEVCATKQGVMHTTRTTNSSFGIKQLSLRYESSTSESSRQKCSSFAGRTVGAKYLIAKGETQSKKVKFCGFEYEHECKAKQDIWASSCSDQQHHRVTLLFITAESVANNANGSSRTQHNLTLTNEGVALLGQTFSAAVAEFSRCMAQGLSFKESLKSMTTVACSRLRVVAYDMVLTNLSLGLCDIISTGANHVLTKAIKHSAASDEWIDRLTPCLGVAVSSLLRPLVDTFLHGFDARRFRSEYFKQLLLNGLVNVLHVSGKPKMAAIVQATFSKTFDSWMRGNANIVVLLFDLMPGVIQALAEAGLCTCFGPWGAAVQFTISYVICPLISLVLQSTSVKKWIQALSMSIKRHLISMAQVLQKYGANLFKAVANAAMGAMAASVAIDVGAEVAITACATFGGPAVALMAVACTAAAVYLGSKKPRTQRQEFLRWVTKQGSHGPPPDYLAREFIQLTMQRLLDSTTFPHELKQLYQTIGDPSKAYDVADGIWTVMSLDGVIVQHNLYRSRCQDCVSVDFAFMYHGMGYYIVCSICSTTGLIYYRLDGGPNGFEADTNFDFVAGGFEPQHDQCRRIDHWFEALDTKQSAQDLPFVRAPLVATSMARHAPPERRCNTTEGGT